MQHHTPIFIILTPSVAWTLSPLCPLRFLLNLPVYSRFYPYAAFFKAHCKSASGVLLTRKSNCSCKIFSKLGVR